MIKSAKRYKDEEDEIIPKSVQKMKRRDSEESIKKKVSSNTRRNYKKNDEQLDKKEQRLGKKKTKKEHPIRRKIITFIFIILVILISIWLVITTNIWRMLARDMLKNENSVVLDIDGNVIATIGDGKIKQTISSDKIPQKMKDAYVSIEDERFYSHGGIDAKRTTAAIGNYIIHFGSSSFGGSTITQQLVKNMTGDSSDKPSRKVKEWWKAITLETCATKDDIITAYLNTIYVGPNVYGVEAGSKYYFNKSAQELSLAECAYMAGINNSPYSYNPFLGNTDNTEKITKRTKIVLTKMKELGKISQEEYNQSIEEVDNGLKFEKGTFEKEKKVYSYHTDAMINEVIDDFSSRYHISKQFASNYLELAGTKIYSTQDSSVQKEIETEFAKTKYQLQSTQGKEHAQAAMVIMDHKTGYVVGIAGGLGTKTESRTFNRATQSVRQTGSAMKPISILVPSFDKKIVTCSTILDDTERDFDEGYHPEDYNKPLGKITLRRAVESSQNVPFVEIYEKLGAKESIKHMKKMGITSLTKKDENPSAIALGGLDKGISPLEMAGAYSTIANDGTYIEPTFYMKIERRNGWTLLKSKQKSKKVMSKETAYVLKELLTQPVLGTNGTATYCKINGVDVAAKTGTTDENYDRWLCGFTPYYTATCWFGFDINETINFNKRNPAGLIWANVMTRIHSGMQSARFEMPKNIEAAMICRQSGKRATTACQDTYKEYFVKGTIPDDCDIHVGSPIVTTENTVKEKSGTIETNQKEIDAEEPQRDYEPKTSSSPEPKTSETPKPPQSTTPTQETSIPKETPSTVPNSNIQTNTTTNKSETTNSTNNISNSSSEILPIKTEEIVPEEEQTD